jgi:hypothetical protein
LPKPFFYPSRLSYKNPWWPTYRPIRLEEIEEAGCENWKVVVWLCSEKLSTAVLVYWINLVIKIMKTLSCGDQRKTDVSIFSQEKNNQLFFLQVLIVANSKICECV